jgi:hypothetical protein
MVRLLQKKTDDSLDRILEALAQFQKDHPDADCAVYRFNSAAIRIRLVDKVFQGKSKARRHEYALKYLSDLDEDVLTQVSVLLCLEPGETSLLDTEFKDPRPSRL